MSVYAIVIGVNHYPPPANLGLKSLAGAILDAQAISEWLLGPGGVPAKNLYLLTSVVGRKKVLRHDVDNAVADITRKVLKNGGDADRLYFYFAGHGMAIENDSNNNGLCLSNWDSILFDAATLSSSDYNRKFVTEGFFKEIVFWMDCCRNKKLRLNPGQSAGVNLRGPNTNPKVFLGFATTYENAAYEATTPGSHNDEIRGIFTEVLLQGLNGEAANGNGTIDTESLTDYLYINVPIAAQRAGFSQMPEIYRNTSSIRKIDFS